MMRTITTALMAFALAPPVAAQEYTVYLRPATDVLPQIDGGLGGGEPARFRYLEEWPGRRECRSVRPVHREDLADYVAELINAGNHYMIVLGSVGPSHQAARPGLADRQRREGRLRGHHGARGQPVDVLRKPTRRRRDRRARSASARPSVCTRR